MPPFETWERIVGFAIAGFSGLLAVSLWYQGLARQYPVFTFFLSFGALRSLFVAVIHLQPRPYFYFFAITELLLMVLYILMLLELYGLVFKKFVGIRAVSRLAISAALGISVILSAVSLGPEIAANEQRRRAAEEVAKAKAKASEESGKPAPPRRSDPRWLLDVFMISERAVLFSLVIMIILMSLTLAWFPIELPRNVVIHSVVFAAFFLSKAGIILYRNINRSQVSDELRSIVMIVGIVCLAVWLWGLRRNGEETNVVMGHLWNRSNEQQLVNQLKGINAALGRLARE